MASRSRPSFSLLLNLSEEDFKRGYVDDRASKPKAAKPPPPPPTTAKAPAKLSAPPTRRAPPPPPPSKKPEPAVVVKPDSTPVVTLKSREAPVVPKVEPVVVPQRSGRGTLLAVFAAAIAGSVITAQLLRQDRFVTTTIGMEASQSTEQKAATVQAPTPVPSSVAVTPTTPTSKPAIVAAPAAKPVIQPAVAKPIHMAAKPAAPPPPKPAASSQPEVVVAAPPAPPPAPAAAPAPNNGLDEAGF